MDARGAPQRVLLAHPLNEFAQLTANSGPAWPAARFPAPIGPKPGSMPPQDRVRLNDAGQTEQGLAKAWSSIPITPGRPTCGAHAAAAILISACYRFQSCQILSVSPSPKADSMPRASTRSVRQQALVMPVRKGAAACGKSAT
jgi:hypothetical protein